MPGKLWYARQRIRGFLRNFVSDEHGMEMIEIVLIAALVVIMSILAWKFLGFAIQSKLHELCEDIVGAGKCGDAPATPTQ